MKRTVVFSSPCRVSLKNCQLLVENQETGEQRRVSVEDLGVVLIENPSVSISVPALNALSVQGEPGCTCETY